MSKKSHSELLGYYFIMFQTTNSNFVKCWIDGSENYTYKTLDEFFKLFDTSKSPKNLKLTAQHYLNTTSIYLWDIDNENIKRVTPVYEESNIGELINQMNPFHRNF